MKIAIEGFQGLYPRLAAQLLPETASTVAENCRLLSGDLEPWLEPELVTPAPLTKAGNINTIYLMDNQYWLHWRENELGDDQISVDVARTPIAQDDTERTIFTGTDKPRVTNLELAVTGTPTPPDDYPLDSFWLGVPAPEDTPTLEISIDEFEDGQLSLLNGDAESGTSSWTAVGGGDFQSIVAADFPGITPVDGTHMFYGGTTATTEAYNQFDLQAAGVGPFQSIRVDWYQAHGPGDSTVNVGFRFFDDSLVSKGEAFAGDALLGADFVNRHRAFTAVVPDEATIVRVVIIMTQGSGGTNDAFVDAVELFVEPSVNNFDGSTLSGWTTTPSVSGDHLTEVTIDPAIGNPAPGFKFESDDFGAMMYRLAGTGNSPLVEFNCDIRLDYDENAGRGFRAILQGSASGKGAGIRLSDDAAEAAIVEWSGWDSDSFSTIELLTVVDDSFIDGPWARLFMKVERKTDTVSTMTVSLMSIDGTTTYIAETSMDVPNEGDYIGLGAFCSTNGVHTYADNISYTVAPGVTTSDETAIFTNYVFTFVNGFGEEGPPSPVSRTIQTSSRTTVTITTPTTSPDPEWNITHKRIYRAVTSATGTEYQLVEEIPLAQAEYEDVKDDEELTDVLETVAWDLPPEDGFGVLAMPNGFMVIASQNTLCPSVVNHSHAYPVPYRLNFQGQIVAIAAIDTNIIVGTTTYPYLVIGSDPSQLSSAKFEQKQACVSKRSMVTIRNYGVIYASPDGLVAINAAGALQLLTEATHTRPEWQAINPETIVAFAHDDRYFGFYTDDSDNIHGFVFDPRQSGNGFTTLTEEAQCGFSNPMDDHLYYVKNNNDLFIWEGGTDKMDLTWKSKLYQLPRAANFRAVQIRADAYDNGTTQDLTWKLYSNGALVHTKTVTSEKEFVTVPNVSTNMQMQIQGNCRVRRVQIAEEMEELD